MHQSNQIGERLREERDRLGLSQHEAADVAGVRREMWGKYERGLAEPGVSIIERFCTHGADALFIVSGQRLPSGAVPLAVLKYTTGFFQRLHKAMDGKPLSAVASQCRLTPAELESYMQGRDFPRLDTAFALATTLRVTPEWLLCGE